MGAERGEQPADHRESPRDGDQFHGVPRVHIALAWLLQKDPVTAPIIGATKISHLEDAIGALSIKLTQEEVAYLKEPYVPHRIVGHQ
jgi:aryl-alcohol dehydrogenase-like predicted oxidoreductase